MDIILEVISQLLDSFLSQVITIPLDNALSVFYVIINTILLLIFGVSS